MSKYLTKRGYVIVKKDFSQNIINSALNDLSVKPFISADYGDMAEPFPVYLQNENKIYMPKYYGIEKFGNPINKLPNPESIDLVFNPERSLRDNQLIPVDACIKAFETKGGGILSLPCGFGKTACACYLISVLKVKTFVMVHKEFLLNQWIERITEFLPNARIGKIQGTVIDIENKDIVIGMIQSISMKKYAINLFDSFGFVILDEAHRCPSEIFSKALLKINSQYMLALSATPDRKDGLTKVLKWFVGDIIYSIKSKVNSSEVRRYIYTTKNESYSKELSNYRGKVNMASMLNNITEFMPRTTFIVSLLKTLVEENRQIILLSSRRNHLKDIFELIEKNSIGTVGYYVGQMKQKDLDISAKKQIILGTFMMAQEGLDINTADTIVLASPQSNIEQAIGRIGRGNIVNTPVVIDIVDTFSIFNSQGFKRLDMYKKKHYLIKTYTVNETGQIMKTHAEILPGAITKKKNCSKETVIEETKEEKEQKLIKFLLETVN